MGVLEKLAVAGFLPADNYGSDVLRLDRGDRFALAMNRVGSGLPREGDWALTSWGPDEDAEAITDAQDNDEGANLDDAILWVLADLEA
jgi:hypothetical protein